MTLHELTAEMAGKKEARLVLLASRPTMGKTSVAMGMALDLAAQGKKVNYFSCNEKLAYLNQHLEFINRGPLSDEIKQNLRTQEPFAFPVADIVALCDNQPDAIFIDTLQEINKADSSFENLQKELKDLAAKFNCPVIVLSKLPAEIDTRMFHKPRLKDLAAENINADLFDEVMLFYRKSRYKLNASKEDCLMVCKNREIKLTWSDVTNCIA